VWDLFIQLLLALVGLPLVLEAIQFLAPSHHLAVAVVVRILNHQLNLVVQAVLAVAAAAITV
jgi:hypothetical protein